MIQFNEIINEKEYRERIIKYFRLPIRLSVTKEQFLSHLDFLNKTDNCKYEEIVYLTENDFNQEVRKQNTKTPDFSMENVLTSIVNQFEETKEWQEFIKKDYSNVLDDFNGITSTHGFYIKENDGKHFLSIDLQAANWQSLQSILGFKESYEKMIIKHTDNLIPPISKTVRTKITGMLDAKKIMNYNQKLLKDNKELILDTIFKETKVDLRRHKITAFYADEFIIELSEVELKKFNSINTEELEESILKNTNIKIHFRCFTLKWLNIDKGCVKIHKNDFEILNISKDVLLIINKLINDIKPNLVDFENIKLKNETTESFCERIKSEIKNMQNFIYSDFPY